MLGRFPSHKIIQKVRVSILIAGCLHVLFSEQVIVGMLFLPLELFPFPLFLLFPGTVARLLLFVLPFASSSKTPPSLREDPGISLRESY